MRGRCLFAVGIVLACTSFVATIASASDEMGKRSEAGGRVVLMRHALTTPGVGDPEGVRLDDCATQRNLSDEGRAHARVIGEAFRARRLQPGRVLSSPWCRCIETAKIAFGGSQAEVSLSNLFGRSQNRDRQVQALRARIAAHRGSDTLVMVTHGSTIFALTGVSPETGEMVVVAPDAGAKLVVEGRLRVPER